MVMTNSRRKPWMLVVGVGIGLLGATVTRGLWESKTLEEDEFAARPKVACTQRTSACGRPLHMPEVVPDTPLACLVCVWQTCGDLYGHSPALWPAAARVGARHARGRDCVPIEALRWEEWRHEARQQDHDHALTGDDTDLRTSGQLAGEMTNKATLIGQDALAPRARKIYIDLGANTYESSIGNWFRESYPGGEDFKVYAFEAEHKYDATYVDHPEVELLHFAAWTSNETLPWGHMAKNGITRSGFLLSRDTTVGRRRRLGKTRHGVVLDETPTRPGIDVADFLRRTVTEDDFVVLKMDIEGTEYDVIPHLINEGVAPLIDEMFVEVHTDTNTCCKPPRDAGRHRADALRLLQRLRDAGVYAHEWL